MRVLAIRLGRFGDLVLLLPALAELKARLPDCHLSLLTDTRWQPLAAMAPAIDDIITVDRIQMRDGPSWRAVVGMMRLVSEVRRRRFDVVIDFHGFRETNLLAWRSGAAQRWGLKRFDQSYLGFCFNKPPVVEDKSLHASESFLRLVHAVAPVSSGTPTQSPMLVPEDALQWAEETLPAAPFSVLFLDAPVPERIWPLDRFAAVANHFRKNLGVPVVAIGANALPPDSLPHGVTVLSQLSIPRLAAIVAKARMLVSNDTGPMHLGPALGVPTVGIFSVGLPAHFRPTGPSDRYVQGNPIHNVGVEEVIEAVNQVWKATDRRDLRR